MSRKLSAAAVCLFALFSLPLQAQDLFDVHVEQTPDGLEVEVVPQVDDALEITLELDTEKLRIEAERVSDGNDQNEDVDLSQADLIDGPGFIRSINVYGTGQDDVITADLREIFDEGFTMLQIHCGGGDDRVTVVGDDQVVDDSSSLLVLTLNGQTGDDVLVNETDADCNLVGGLGFDQLQGGDGSDHFYPERILPSPDNPQQTLCTLDHEDDHLTDAGGRAFVHSIAIPVVDQVTKLSRNVWRPLSDFPKLAKQWGAIQSGTSKTPLSPDFPSTRVIRGKVHVLISEAYAKKTTYRWDFPESNLLMLATDRLFFETHFCERNEDDDSDTFIRSSVSFGNAYQVDAPELEPLVESL